MPARILNRFTTKAPIRGAIVRRQQGEFATK
jgi:hypothetical protein